MQLLETKKATDMKLTTIGIDLAKNVFQVHGTDEKGKAVMKKQLKRTRALPFFANLTPCRIGIETCGSGSHRSRPVNRASSMS